MINTVLIGAFFCYGVFTLQRPGFLLSKLPTVWKKLPKKLHEPLFSCGVCVSSIWGIVFILAQYFIHNELLRIPIYIIAMCGVCALVDRAVKYFEYGYKYNSISPMADYSYLSNYKFRDSLYDCFLQKVVRSGIPILEIGGITESLKYSNYSSIDKQSGTAVEDFQSASADSFILIKGLAFEGNFDKLLHSLSLAQGFIIEGSVGGESGKQIQWIMDKFDLTIKIPYTVNDNLDCRPDHCGNTNNRVVLIKQINE